MEDIAIELGFRLFGEDAAFCNYDYQTLKSLSIFEHFLFFSSIATDQ